MENNRFFAIVQRINSVLFLLLLLGGVGLMLLAFFETSSWERRDTVVVTEENGNREREFFVGSLVTVQGHDVQYVELESRDHGGKFSSGGYGSQTRNLLFLRGNEMQATWLFEGNGQMIRTHHALAKDGINGESDCDGARNGTQPVLALYYEVVRGNADDSGEFEESAPASIALSRPDGSGYRELEPGVRRVIQKQVLDDGATLSLLLQDGPRLVLKRYSLRSFDKISEREIATLVHAR